MKNLKVLRQDVGTCFVFFQLAFKEKVQLYIIIYVFKDG